MTTATLMMSDNVKGNDYKTDIYEGGVGEYETDIYGGGVGENDF